MTRFVHHCVDKALHIAGRGRAPKRLIATDDRCRMSVAALEAAIEQDIADGIRPWLVVASAGTIDTGSVDPLQDIADVCAPSWRLASCRRRLWRPLRIVR